MGFLKKLKHKTKPVKITPVVHIAPPPQPKQIIHEVKEILKKKMYLLQRRQMTLLFNLLQKRL